SRSARLASARSLFRTACTFLNTPRHGRRRDRMVTARLVRRARPGARSLIPRARRRPPGDRHFDISGETASSGRTGPVVRRLRHRRPALRVVRPLQRRPPRCPHRSRPAQALYYWGFERMTIGTDPDTGLVGVASHYRPFRPFRPFTLHHARPSRSASSSASPTATPTPSSPVACQRFVICPSTITPSGSAGPSRSRSMLRPSPSRPWAPALTRSSERTAGPPPVDPIRDLRGWSVSAPPWLCLAPAGMGAGALDAERHVVRSKEPGHVAGEPDGLAALAADAGAPRPGELRPGHETFGDDDSGEEAGPGHRVGGGGDGSGGCGHG